MKYDPAAPTVYFDIGAAVAAIAILLAFVALATPTHRFRWSLGWFRLRTAYCLFFIGITFVLIAAILPIIPFRLPHATGYPLFWELLGGLAFIFGSLGLIVQGFRPVLFTAKNAERFFWRCYSIIARGDNKEVGALAEEISASAHNIVNACNDYDEVHAHAAKQEGKEYPIAERTRWAFDILDLWSDRRLCNAIVTRCPDTARTYFQEIQKAHMYNSGGYSFIRQLIAEAFRDPDSILHREERYAGLGHFLLFSETVFGNYAFVSSHFKPLEAAGFSHDNIRNLNKYISCLHRAMKAYLDSGNYFENRAAIWWGVEILPKSACHFVSRLPDSPRHATIEDSPTWALWQITRAFRDLLKLVVEYEEKLPDWPFDPEDVEGIHDRSIYQTLAEGIYEYFDCLTRIEGHDWDMRQTVLELWMELYSPSASKEPQSKVLVEIQKRLEARLWVQVERNLEDARLCYPMITRLLISLNGLHPHVRASEGRKRFSEELLRLLRTKFDAATRIADDRESELLPEGFEYDAENKQIVQKSRWGGEPTVLQCE